MTHARDKAHELTVPAVLALARSAGFTQAELGEAVGASERTIQSWASAEGSRPTGVKLRRLLDIQVIVTLLQNVYTDEGINIWLHSRNLNLGLKRPIDLMAEGGYDQVLDEAYALAKAM